MEIGNVSYQLFSKQLPADQNAAYVGCKEDFNTPYLTTCVDNQKSDIAIEDAFQKQLSMGEYYKSPYVFDAIKKEYIEPTMEHQHSTGQVEGIPKQPKEVSSQPPNVTVGPMDFLKLKERFGSFDGLETFAFIVGAVLSIFGLSIIIYRDAIPFGLSETNIIIIGVIMMIVGISLVVCHYMA